MRLLFPHAPIITLRGDESIFATRTLTLPCASLHLAHEQREVEAPACRFSLQEDSSPQGLVAAIAEVLLKAMECIKKSGSRGKSSVLDLKVWIPVSEGGS
jgi:hypothetical protein